MKSQQGASLRQKCVEIILKDSSNLKRSDGNCKK